ncbi:MAG: periplasmic heavy metal sensor [bacterium]
MKILSKYLLLILTGVVIALVAFYLGQKYYLPDDYYLVKKLHLNEQQKQHYLVLKDTLKNKQQNLCDQLCTKRSELSDLLTATPLDKKKINYKVEEISTLQTAVEKHTIDFICSFQEILNDEQRKKFLNTVNDEICRFNTESIGYQHHRKMMDERGIYKGE